MDSLGGHGRVILNGDECDDGGVERGACSECLSTVISGGDPSGE